MEVQRELDLQEREKLNKKNGILAWVGANDCVKDKIIGDYEIQVMEIDTKEMQQIQLKANHYEYMKKKLKSRKDKREKESQENRLSMVT